MFPGGRSASAFGRAGHLASGAVGYWRAIDIADQGHPNRPIIAGGSTTPGRTAVAPGMRAGRRNVLAGGDSLRQEGRQRPARALLMSPRMVGH